MVLEPPPGAALAIEAPLDPALDEHADVLTARARRPALMMRPRRDGECEDMKDTVSVEVDLEVDGDLVSGRSLVIAAPARARAVWSRPVRPGDRRPAPGRRCRGVR